ncbi:hypothetical protein IW492_02920 [Enterococcus sp. BWB1-3]|uniref:hypothetical protein n=1 Tax=Enterococcus sp. BWB1-3 TaxID=2787713 RepID=UPI001921030F|nr:hypothetical protein [Enterococcus sp. BWB1-3]MBL1228184.1 hypothetical protein [Enterococcus sp. BWB1-3]
MRCPVCQNKNVKSDHVYCGICGTKIKKDEPSANEFDQLQNNLNKVYHEKSETEKMKTIKQLTNELLNACIEDGISAIVIIEEKEKRANEVYRVGAKANHFRQLLSLLDTLSENCNCPHCQNRRAAEKEREGDSINKDEVFSMLAKMMKGVQND